MSRRRRYGDRNKGKRVLFLFALIPAMGLYLLGGFGTDSTSHFLRSDTVALVENLSINIRAHATPASTFAADTPEIKHVEKIVSLPRILVPGPTSMGMALAINGASPQTVIR